MKLVNLNGPQDVMALLVRRKWWIVLPFIALSAGVTLITIMLPQMYVSQSLVVIRPREVSDDLVKNLIVGSTAERLSIITERVLSDTNLGLILKEKISKDEISEDKDKTFGDLPEFHGLSVQEKIVKLRKQVDLQFSAGEQLKKGQLPVTAFRILCWNRSGMIAQKIAIRLTNLFIEKDTENRQANVNDTASFLQIQVDQKKAELALSDGKLKELKSRRRDELPNQLESNLRRLENLTTENQELRKQLTTFALAVSAQEKEMALIPKLIPSPSDPAAQVTAQDPNVVEYREMLAALRVQARLGHTDIHPDVARLNLRLQRVEEGMTKEQIALAKKQDVPQAAATPADSDAMQPNPLYMRMEISRDSWLKQIESYEAQIAQNDEKIKTYNQHVNNVPEGEEELSDVLRENNDLNRQYYELNSKLAAVNLSASAENQQKGASFEVVDSASLPINPTKPSRPSIVSAGLVLSLLIALGIGFVVDIANQKTWTQSDVVSLLGVKVLAEVPRIVTRNGVARTRKKKVGFMASVGVASVAYAFCLYVAYNHSGFVIRSLDPLIQKLY